ncbi:MAG: hypothetical protein KGH93_02020 [Patescibacteria group bacterium]|nr:hypothetical protein [Patescibacteria group bacterium]MDE1945955.1 hypothetical protein [Patescibacteria group bacterium]
MSRTAKTVLIVIVLAVIVAIIWMYVPKSGMNWTNQPAGNYVASSTDTSDAAMNQDMSNINAQLDGLNSDTANLDASSTQ